MNMIKAILLAVVMMISVNAFAMTDEQHMRYTEALRDGNVKLVKQYLDEGVSVDEKFYTWEALQIAANKGQLEVVKLLVEKGANVNYKHPIIHMTALHMAAFTHNIELVKYLISKGADVNAKMRGDESLISVLRGEGGYEEMIDYLKSAGATE